jgi:hypothetical protein
VSSRERGCCTVRAHRRTIRWASLVLVIDANRVEDGQWLVTLTRGRVAGSSNGRGRRTTSIAHSRVGHGPRVGIARATRARAQMDAVMLLEVILSRAACLTTWEGALVIALSGVDALMTGEMSRGGKGPGASGADVLLLWFACFAGCDGGICGLL